MGDGVLVSSPDSSENIDWRIDPISEDVAENEQFSSMLLPWKLELSNIFKTFLGHVQHIAILTIDKWRQIVRIHPNATNILILTSW